MKNVCASAALSLDVYHDAIDAAALHGITLSAFINLAIVHLLHMDQDELSALCAGAGRKAKREKAEAADE